MGHMFISRRLLRHNINNNILDMLQLTQPLMLNQSLPCFTDTLIKLRSVDFAWGTWMTWSSGFHILACAFITVIVEAQALHDQVQRHVSNTESINHYLVSLFVKYGSDWLSINGCIVCNMSRMLLLMLWRSRRETNIWPMYSQVF